MQTVKLWDILTVFNGYAFKKGDYRESWILLFRQSNIGEWIVRTKKSVYLDPKFMETCSEFIIQEWDVLVGMSWSIGEYCIYDLKTPALQNQRTWKLIFYKPEMSHYVLHYLPLLVKQLKDKAKWVAVQNISWKDLENMEIPLYSLTQQQDIVDEIEKQISRLDNGLQSLENIKADLKSYKASVLKSAVEGKLTEQRRKENKNIESASKLLENILSERKKQREQNNQGKKYKEPQKVNTDWLSELPEWWCWSSLWEAYSVFVWSTPSRGNKDYWWWNIKRISSWEVHFNDIYDTEEKITKAGLDNSSTKIHPSWTIMIGMIGEWKTRWQVAMLRVDACHNQNTAAIEVDNDFLSSEYLYYFLYSCYQKMRSIWWGGNQKALSKWIIETIIVPLPPLAEQKAITQYIEEKLSVTDVILNTIETNIKRAKQLKQSILHKAFTWQLIHMKEDNNWVNELLAEIKKSKAMLVWQKKDKKIKQK